MKKIFFLFLFLLVSVSFLQSQTFLVETFDGAGMPAGWTIQNQSSNWSISNSANAGGSPRELHLTWSPQFNGKTRFISPVINLTGATDLVVEFLHYLDNYQGTNTIGIETTSNGGTTWNLAFQKNFSSSGGGKVIDVISTSDVGSSNFQFCLFFNGSSYNINDWYFDDFKLFARYGVDAAMASINTEIFNTSGEHTIKATVTNVGLTTINSIQMRYQFDDDPAVTETFSSLNLLSLSSQQLSFTQKANVAPGAYTLKVEILTVNGAVDNNPDNNIATKPFYAATQTGNRKVCIEHFTSSTCPPCVSPNAQMKALLENPNNIGKFSISKYQMNWPAPGDPYYTAEGGARRNYYGVNAVPHIMWNAKYSMSINQTTLNNMLAEPAFIDIDGSFSVAGNIVNINAQITSYLEIPQARLYVIVNEKRTVGNIGTNGEQEFFHVMMKILNSGNGENVSFQTDEMKTFSYTFDMTTTNVEEMNDLEVHVFLQDYDSKYIFNSSFLTENAACLPPVNLTANYNASSQSVVLNWEDANDPSDSFSILFNNTPLQSNVTGTTFTHENVPGGKHKYGVFAVVGGINSVTSEVTVEICSEPKDFAGDQDGNKVVLTWLGTNIPHKLFFNGVILAENITSSQYTHTNVPEGTHTYGIQAVGTECTSDIVEITVKVTLSVQNLELNYEIFPNPANQYIMVKGKELETITIYSSFGQLIHNLLTDNETVKINTKDMSDGIYYLQIRNKQGMTKIEKIVIIK